MTMTVRGEKIFVGLPVKNVQSRRGFLGIDMIHGGPRIVSLAFPDDQMLSVSEETGTRGHTWESRIVIPQGVESRSDQTCIKSVTPLRLDTRHCRLDM